MTTADSLFKQALSKIPDPKNPKPGDTYEYTVDYSFIKLTTRIVVIDHNEEYKSTRCYINGELKGGINLEFLIRSVKGAQPVITES